MNKQEFLTELRKGLSGLPQNDIEERLAFYGEMLDDRIEEGLSEDAAVAEIGDANEIVRQTVADIPLAKLAKERIKPKRRLRAWEIILLALGSPVWLSILIAAAAVIFSLYVSVWAVIAVMRSACRGRQRRFGDCYAFGGNYMRGAFDIYVLRLQGDCKRNFDSYKEDNHRDKKPLYRKGGRIMKRAAKIWLAAAAALVLAGCMLFAGTM